jgi:aminopeptidase N
VLDLPDAQDAAFESGNALLIPFLQNDTGLLLAAARQVAHAAFPSPRLWISEGLAGYAQAAYMQNQKGRAAAIAYLQGHRAALVQSEKENLAQADAKAAAHSLINDPDQFYVETKAMNVWWMLRDMVGETAFAEALRNYNPAEDKDAYYMQKLFEARAHRELAWFFDDWVYRDRGLPELRILSVYPRQLVGGGYLVTVTVENSGQAGAETPVTLHMAEGESTERLVVPGNSKASVRIRAPMLPQEATVNDGSVPEANSANDSFKINVTE